MATLADELLADLMDSGSEGEGGDQGYDEFGFATTGVEDEVKDGMQMDDGEEDDDDEEADEEAAYKVANSLKKAEDPDMPTGEQARARVEKQTLMKTLKPIIEKIEFFQQPKNQAKNVGNIEDNPEYKLLTDANKFATQIESEVKVYAKYIKDRYSLRFAALETLVPNDIQYAQTVAIIGNGPMENLKDIIASTDNLIGKTLHEVLDGPTLMSVRMEASTSDGSALSEEQLTEVMRACEITLQLEKAKGLLTEYVQSRMNLFAPNLTVLVGSETAAKLVNKAGGLASLAKTPSCNIANYGWNTKSGTGLATNVGVRQKGFLYYSPIIQHVPNDLKTQAMRIIAAKVVLAARVDQTLKTGDNSTGLKLLEDCHHRLDKLMEPPPNKGPRALPAPDDKPARKRGGRRAREAKKQFEMTDLRKQQNRMVFGKEEAETGFGTGDSTKGLGMIGATNDGRVRATQIDKKTAARLSKKNPGWGGGAATPANGLASSLRGFGQGVGSGQATVLKAKGLLAAGVGTGNASGSASVIAFTPVQGLELVNPKIKAENERKRAAEQNDWFKSGTFTNVGGGTSMLPPAPKVDAGGFKVPALPALKKVKAEK